MAEAAAEVGEGSAMGDVSVLVEGIYFGEGLRWHKGRLWYSDMYGPAVHAVSLDGTDEKIVEVKQQPSGLGWLPDGTMLVVSMVDRCLLRLERDGLAEYADLSGLATFHANDLVVDADGRAYVTNFGFDLDGLMDAEGPAALFAEPGPQRGAIAIVEPDGRVRAGPQGLRFGNGMAITPDGGTFVVAETLGHRLVAYDRAGDGSLANPRTFADLEYRMPDGICLDAEGCVWTAIATAPECIRVAPGGEILDQVATTSPSYCCSLGGLDGTTLFIATAAASHVAIASTQRSGRILMTEVAVPGIGSP